MFHLFNKIYIAKLSELDSKKNSIIVSTSHDSLHYVDHLGTLKYAAVTFDSLIADHFNNDLESFWQFLLEFKDKLILYVDSDVGLRLKLMLWRNIFQSELTDVAAFNIYLGDFEGESLRAFRRHSLDISKFGYAVEETCVEFTTFSKLFNKTPRVILIQEMDKSQLGIDYLIPYFILGDEDNSLRKELLKRVKRITWETWIDEYIQLKYELLTGVFDINKIDPEIVPQLGKLKEAISNSPLLSWLLDNDINVDNVSYIRNKYNQEIFLTCWERYYEARGVQEDMREVTNLIYSDDYETLIQRDIDSGYGCVYASAAFENKCNRIFISYCYDLIRNNKITELKQYQLR